MYSTQLVRERGMCIGEFWRGVLEIFGDAFHSAHLHVGDFRRSIPLSSSVDEEHVLETFGDVFHSAHPWMSSMRWRLSKR